MKAIVQSRDVSRDLRWGIGQGLILTSVAFIPAILAALIGRRELLLFVEVFALYLAFGSFAGALVGLSRPWLSRPSVVTCLGALIGAVGVMALVCFPMKGKPAPTAGLAAFSAVVGALTGAFTATVFGMRRRRERSRT